jgi:hypothetical protein
MGKLSHPLLCRKRPASKPSSSYSLYSLENIFFFIIFESKNVQKSQNMKLQKHYLEVSNSFRKEVRAFFRFTAKRKNYEFFQTSQKKRLEILRCVVLKKVFSKKRSFSVQKTRPPLPSETILNPSRPGTLCSARQSGCCLL